MEKFIKSIFSPSTPEKRRNMREHHEIEGESDNPIGERRKLSMSRSGRLKHSNKKRHSLSLDLYGKEDAYLKSAEPRRKSLSIVRSNSQHLLKMPCAKAKHVSRTEFERETNIIKELQQSEKPKSKEYHVNQPTERKPGNTKRKSIDSIIVTPTNNSKSPEEEIDIAFEIIDKS